MSSTETFTCPDCGRTSHNPNDVEHRYCGACHWWTGDPLLGPFRPVQAGTGEENASAR